MIKFSVSGAGNIPNCRNESATFLEPETDETGQFLGPETVFHGQVELYGTVFWEQMVPLRLF